MRGEIVTQPLACGLMSWGEIGYSNNLGIVEQGPFETQLNIARSVSGHAIARCYCGFSEC